MAETRWCPRCGSEYRAEITSCADCGVALVDEEPSRNDASPSSPVDSDGPVEYDLSQWPEDSRVDLGWMLKGRDIPYDLDSDGTLVVPGARSDEVDGFLEYLSAGPADADDAMDADWRLAAANATSAPIQLTVDEFYDGDPARLDSDEVEFGDEWVDEHGVRCEVSWIHDTGELFVVRAPRWEPLWVEVLAVIPTLEEVKHILQGWEAAMLEPNSVEWVRTRVVQHDDAPAVAAPEPAEVGALPEAGGQAGDLLAELNAKFEREQAEWSREHGS